MTLTLTLNAGRAEVPRTRHETANEHRDRNGHSYQINFPLTPPISKDHRCYDRLTKGHFLDAGECEQNARIICSSFVQRSRPKAVCPSSNAYMRSRYGSYGNHVLIVVRHVRTFTVGHRGSSRDRESYPTGHRSFHSASISRSPASPQQPLVLVELPSGEKKDL